MAARVVGAHVDVGAPLRIARRAGIFLGDTEDTEIHGLQFGDCGFEITKDLGYTNPQLEDLREPPCSPCLRGEAVRC